MKSCFGYVRVSTQKQGEGVSLEAQRDAITVFASRHDLIISQWFEEKESAAKRGRPIFNQMLQALKKGQADGVIIHKIDRSARNLRDWVIFSELPDAGISVHVATESLDFNSRGGRLTADIQAVIAADYIRNLREECIKGMNGRLKQGLFPWAAPPGYLDQGGGKPKIPCPKTAPLIKQAFELYASRQYSYETLLTELHARGLRNRRGGRLTLCGLGNILQNPFYIGMIYVKSTGQTHKGVHEGIISAALWKRVQQVRCERSGPKATKHNHLYQGLFRCGPCGRPMVPERQKGHVYYRCKGQDCATKTVREEVLDDAIRSELSKLSLAARAKQVAEELDSKVDTYAADQQRKAASLRISETRRRLARLEDLLLDDTIDAETYKSKRHSLQIDLVAQEEDLKLLPSIEQLRTNQSKLAELRNSLCLLYEMANRAEKRCIIENVWPNRTVVGRTPAFEPYSWVVEAKSDPTLLCGAHHRHRGRTEEGKKSDEELFGPLLNLLSFKQKEAEKDLRDAA